VSLFYKGTTVEDIDFTELFANQNNISSENIDPLKIYNNEITDFMALFQRGRVLGQSRYGTLLLRMRMVDVFPTAARWTKQNRYLFTFRQVSPLF
jgi:hypothetical protein